VLPQLAAAIAERKIAPGRGEPDMRTTQRPLVDREMPVDRSRRNGRPC